MGMFVKKLSGMTKRLRVPPKTIPTVLPPAPLASALLLVRFAFFRAADHGIRLRQHAFAGAGLERMHEKKPDVAVQRTGGCQSLRH